MRCVKWVLYRLNTYIALISSIFSILNSPSTMIILKGMNFHHGCDDFIFFFCFLSLQMLLRHKWFIFRVLENLIDPIMYFTSRFMRKRQWGWEYTTNMNCSIRYVHYIRLCTSLNRLYMWSLIYSRHSECVQVQEPHSNKSKSKIYILITNGTSRKKNDEMNIN